MTFPVQTWRDAIAERVPLKGRDLNLQAYEVFKLRGQLQGQRKLLMHQLETKFGELPPDVVTRIKAIEDETLLEALSEQVLTATTLSGDCFGRRYRELPSNTWQKTE